MIYKTSFALSLSKGRVFRGALLWNAFIQWATLPAKPKVHLFRNSGAVLA